MLLSDAIAAYTTDRHARGEISAATARQLGWRLGLLSRACPGLDVAELSRGHILEWQRQIGWQRPATRRGYLSTVRTFCGWAIDTELLTVDPTARLAPVREPRGEPRCLSAGRVARLQMILPDDRARLIVALMHQLGLRCVEVARLTVADWDPYAAELRLVGKGGHVRYGQVLDDLAVMLERRCAGRTGPIVGVTAGRISILVSRWMDTAGIKGGRYDGVSAHALRHTSASNLLDGCGNVRLVQEFLGHASLATTERYLRRHSRAEIRAAMVQVNRRTAR
jgi:site-specific recombinase XerC